VTQEQPNIIYLKDYQPVPYTIDSVDLRVAIHESETFVTARCKIRRTGESNAPLVWAGDELELMEVAVNGRRLSASEYSATPSELRIEALPESFELQTMVRIFPHQNTTLQGLYKSATMFCTQCEAEGFRRITYFYDRPDVMTVYTTTIEADKTLYPVLLSNGNFVSRGDSEAGRHWATWHDPFKKPSYLFAAVAGNLACLRDSYRTASGRNVKLEIYAVEADIPKCHHAMESLKQSMKWDEESYGRECDLGNFMIVAVSDFNAGAMENKGLNIFNISAVLASSEMATDGGFARVQGVVAHEYFHNWTGNRVTCRDWFQLCLKEGLTRFRDQQFSADLNSAAVERISDVIDLRARQFPEDAGPMAHPVRPESFIDISNFYTSTVYEKGAELCRMLRTLVGPTLWRKGTDLYFERHDGQAVTVEEFVGALADASGRNLDQFMRWYRQAGTPVVGVERCYDAARRRYTLTVSQSTPKTPDGAEKLPLLMPMLTALIGRDGREIPLRLAGEKSALGTERVIELSGASQQFVFEDVSSEPVPSLFRGFSAPINLEIAYDDDELLFLLEHDGDPFNRFDAGQKVIIKTILSMAEAIRGGKSVEPSVKILEALFATVRSRTLDDHFKALMLRLPELDVLMQKVVEIDLPSLHAATEQLRLAMARRFETEMVAFCDAMGEEPGYVFEAKAVGRRYLRNSLLGYLVALEKEEHLTRVERLYRSATNMNDQEAAFSLIVSSSHVRRDEIVSDFYERWKHEELVVNAWFRIQATANHKNVVSRVRELTCHPDFRLSNPNRARAVLVGFSLMNIAAFHHPSGEGYKIFVEQVLELAKINPQVASRAVRSFSGWKRLEPRQRELCKSYIERLATLENPPKDFFEMVQNLLKN
jgi:aminopeptidase N